MRAADLQSWWSLPGPASPQGTSPTRFASRILLAYVDEIMMSGSSLHPLTLRQWTNDKAHELARKNPLEYVNDK